MTEGETAGRRAASKGLMRAIGGHHSEREGPSAREALLTAAEVASYFGVEKITIYRWCREGRIPCLKIGKHWRVRRDELADFLREAEGATPRP